MDQNAQFGLIIMAVLLGGPLLLGIVGWARFRSEGAAGPRAPGRLTALSLLIYTLAFNLTFFIQELFLVVPKALTPGLRPTLYHNNHNWDGSHPLERLFQGTGALAILIIGLVFAWLAKRQAGRTEGGRLFVLWMAYHGLFQSLPQLAFAPIGPGSDTGQALDWFKLPYSVEILVGLAAALAIIAAGVFMTRRFLKAATGVETRAAQAQWIARVAVLPAVLAIPLLILFRVPREWSEVVVPTIAVPLVGLSWVQAMSWWVDGKPGPALQETRSLVTPAAAVVVLLLIFQLVLRPGIPFY